MIDAWLRACAWWFTALDGTAYFERGVTSPWWSRAWTIASAAAVMFATGYFARRVRRDQDEDPDAWGGFPWPLVFPVAPMVGALAWLFVPVAVIALPYVLPFVTVAAASWWGTAWLERARDDARARREASDRERAEIQREIDDTLGRPS